MSLVFVQGMFVLAFLSSSAQAEGPKGLTNKDNEPIPGEATNVVRSTVYFKDEAGNINTCELDNLSESSREEVLTWILPYVLKNNRYFDVSVNLKHIEAPVPSNTPATSYRRHKDEYECKLTNYSPMVLPKDVKIAYNVHTLYYYLRKDRSDSDEYVYGFDQSRPEVCELAPSADIAPGKSLSFNTPRLRSTTMMPGTSEIPSWEDLNNESFSVSPSQRTKWASMVVKHTIEIRLYIGEKELYRYLEYPALEEKIGSSWLMPSLHFTRTPDPENAPSAASRSTPNAHSESSNDDPFAPVNSATLNSSENETPPDVPVIPYNSLVIINVDNGTGSGFLMKMKEREFLVTNIHVVAGAQKVTCKTVNGETIQLPDTFFIAKDRDLALIPISHEGDYLEVVDDLTQDLSIGDWVTVFGNEAGASVVTQLSGKVKGIGPERIEVDAKFVEGNSGSPVIHHNSGKVVGIAAFYIEYAVPKADRAPETNNRFYSRMDANREPEKVRRRFAERVDNPSDWEQTSFLRMQQEREAHDEYVETLNGVVEIAAGIYKDKRVLKPNEGNEKVQHLLEDFHAVFRNASYSKSTGNQRALRDLQNRLYSLMDTAHDRAESKVTSKYYSDEIKRLKAFQNNIQTYLEGVYTE